ncbi:glucosaminidase domain-containing protein [Acidithiobacillus sp. MC6.1]|nr:glucosaminidase domain-containing protein [Acidithiobacillus sp. MC6.1]
MTHPVFSSLYQPMRPLPDIAQSPAMNAAQESMVGRPVLNGKGATSAQRENSAASYAQTARTAEQFAGIFIDQLLERMMPKLFGSAAGAGTYQAMLLQSLSTQLSQTGNGMGLVPILDKALGVPAAAATAIGETPPVILEPSLSNAGWAGGGIGSSATLSASAQAFIAQLTPLAKRVGKLLGVAPKLLLAQAALETGWGAHVVGNNLFGIKALPGEPSVLAPTHETVNGVSMPTIAAFRAFSSVKACMEHYARLIKEHYPQAMDTGGDVQAFVQGLVRGGYATDPAYAAKITQVAELPVWSHISGAP